ncbi:protocadherin-18-like isoform X4 [Hippocampus comes]|uniref:protocadherin-18-like isoform X4 n=1 Tax=Hippocampus comes TaxID=109280 RepID=UPI00094EF915|nr:PREDICTED: protocadherin-18-like isoform X4 [Hippocampus comes]
MGAKGNLLHSAQLQLFLLMAVFNSICCTTLKYQVHEEQRAGIVIARLKDDVTEVLSKLPSSVSLRFRAMQRSSMPLLSVREEDGEISIGSKIDREKLCEKNVNCSIEFDVVTLPTEYLQLFHVAVEVLDINDNSPHFSHAIVPIEISESASIGTRIPLDGAVDADVGENSLHTYALSPNNFFKIDIRTRTDGAKYTELVVIRELDREVQSNYQLQLIASDNGVPPKSGSTLLKISIADSNDNSPAFEEQAYVINLMENSPLGTLVIDLNATDPDEGTNGKIVYAFSSHVPSKILERFKINPENGHITMIKMVDYELSPSYELDVQAQDLGPNSIPGLCKIVVKVVDVNDNKPEININLMTPGKEEVAYISEGAPVDTFIALVRIDDSDTGLNGEVVCRLHGHGHFRLQKTYEKNYMILTNISLDREKRSEYSLTVIAEDQGSPSLSTIKHFTVQVLDENDNPPRFEKNHYEVFKSENNSPGAYLTTVVASDPDLGTNGQVTYAIIDAPVQGSSISTYVTIDPSNGAIYALRTFDHEDVSHVTFTIQARDGGNPSLSANTTLLVTVLDENDNPPIIHSPSLQNHTAELPVWKYASPGQLITALQVTDRDAGANGESHPRSPSASPLAEKGTPGSRQSHHSRQSLNSLVTISSNHVPENFALELPHTAPPVEQVSQLLSMLHQGQYQPRPSFRGNKHTRSYRYALNEMDKFSLKDSGRGDSDAGDSDYEPGRDSPVDRLLGEGLAELYAPDVHHRTHTAMRLCTEECRVLGHSDQCWMPPLESPESSSSDYRSNLYIPRDEACQPTDQSQDNTPQPCIENGSGRNQSFSTFGKNPGRESIAEEKVDVNGGDEATDEELCGASSLLSEMSSIFQRLLPQSLDSYGQVNEKQKGMSFSGIGVSMTGSLDRKRDHLPGKTNPSIHQQGVAAWAANTHFQNPGNGIIPSGHHQGGGYYTLKPCTKLSFQSSNHSNSQAVKNSQNPKSHSCSMLTARVSPTGKQTCQASVATTVPIPGPSSKWLPAMEEIPENYEEDDFDSVLSHLQGKRSDSRRELVDASELVAEINQLLQDVRQS